MKTVKQKSKLNHWTPLAIIGLIAIILVAVIAIFPFIYMILMSFTDSRTLQLHLSNVNFTDLSNFIYIFNNSGFLQAFVNSIIVVVVSCVLNVIISCMASRKNSFPAEILFSRFI